MNNVKITLLGTLHFILIAAAQIFIFNNVHFLGYINPMLYVWFILMLPYKTPRWLLLAASFLMGLCIDIFSFQVGFNIAVSVFIAFIRPFILGFFINNKEITVFERPTANNMGFAAFILYIAIMVLLHNCLYFTLELFRLTELASLLFRILLSSTFTIVIIIICDMIFFRNKKEK